MTNLDVNNNFNPDSVVVLMPREEEHALAVLSKSEAIAEAADKLRKILEVLPQPGEKIGSIACLELAKSLNGYYAEFKQRMLELGFSESSKGYALFSKVWKKISIEQTPNHRRALMQRILDEIQLNDIARSFANLPLDRITIMSFCEKIKEIQAIFPEQLLIRNIHYALRDAIVTRHGAQGLQALASEYLNLSSIRRGLIENSLKDFLAQKPALEAREKALRGPTGFDGEIHSAWLEQEKAKSGLDAARHMVTETMKHVISLQAQTTLVNAFIETREAYTAAWAKKGELDAELKQISRLSPQGTLAQIDKIEANFESAVKEEAAKIAGFYAELGKGYSKDDIQAAFLAMEKIIN